MEHWPCVSLCLRSGKKQDNIRRVHMNAEIIYIEPLLCRRSQILPLYQTKYLQLKLSRTLVLETSGGANANVRMGDAV